MKKLTKILAVVSLAFFAAACSESPMGPQLDDPNLNAAEATWSGSVVVTGKKDDEGSKKKSIVERATSGYALGM